MPIEYNICITIKYLNIFLNALISQFSKLYFKLFRLLNDFKQGKIFERANS